MGRLDWDKIFNERTSTPRPGMATDRHAERTGDTTRQRATVLGALAVVLLAHPLYLWPQLGSDPSGMLLAGVVRPVLTLLGGFLLPYAGLAAYNESWRPVGPRTAVLFPVVASLAVLELQWYDEAVLGLVGLHALNNNPVLAGAFSLVFLVGGSLVRREQRRAVGAFILGCLALLLVGIVVDGTRPPIAVVSGVALGVTGVLVGGIGYALTAPVEGHEDPAKQ